MSAEANDRYVFLVVAPFAITSEGTGILVISAHRQESTANTARDTYNDDERPREQFKARVLRRVLL